MNIESLESIFEQALVSVAGRVAILFGGFYGVGDRVQVGEAETSCSSA